MTENELYYYRQIESLNGERARYVNLKTSLNNSLIPCLSKPCDDLELANTGVSSSFTIDGSGIDKNNISKQKTKINGIISKIQNTIIPEINNKISSIDGSIDYYDYLIRKEREKGSE